MKYSQFTQTALNEKHKSPPTTSSFEAMLNVNDGRGDDWDEEGPLLSPRASIAERRLNVVRLFFSFFSFLVRSLTSLFIQ